MPNNDKVCVMRVKKPIELDVVREIKHELGSFNTEVLIYFCSADGYDNQVLAHHFYDEFYQVKSIIGCTAYDELFNGYTTHHGVVVMALSSEAVSDSMVCVVENIDKDFDVLTQFDIVDRHFKCNTKALGSDSKLVGVCLIDGVSGREETVAKKIADRTNMLVIGGSASDALTFDNVALFANGKVYRNAAVVLVMQMVDGVDYVKTQSASNKNVTLVPTKVDESRRTVIELNNKPAMQEYTKAIGVSREEAKRLFFHYPLGLIGKKNEVYLRSVKALDGDSLQFYCAVHRGDNLRLMCVKNIITDTKAAINNKVIELGGISGLIDFRCILRTTQLQNEGAVNVYGDIFEGIPSIGFSTYGECLNGKHINQTSTMLIIR